MGLEVDEGLHAQSSLHCLLHGVHHLILVLPYVLLLPVLFLSRQAQAGEYVNGVLAACSQLRANEAFQTFDDGNSATYVWSDDHPASVQAG